MPLPWDPQSGLTITVLSDFFGIEIIYFCNSESSKGIIKDLG